MRTKTPAGKSVHYIMWETGFGGLELSVIHYINHFYRQRPLFAYSLRPGNDKVYDETKIRLQSGKKNDWDCYRLYFLYCRRYKGDIFQLMSTGPVILLLTLLAGVRNPLYHIHGTKHWKTSFQKFYLKIFWWVSSLFPFKIVANSIHSADIFRRQVLGRKSQIVYNGIAAAHFAKNKRMRTNLQKIGYAGRLNDGKNVHLVIRLFEEIAADYPQLELWLAGHGPLRPSLEKQAGQSPFNNRIRFLGTVKDMPAFYESLDLMLFLSAHESFGNVLVEALLNGLPVLTSNVPAFNEIYGGEPDFVLGDPADYAILKAGFLKALEHFPSLAGKAWLMSADVYKQFDIQPHLEQIERIYESLH
jgi:glycosyltransferase involved in cell wall biosynthesis